MHIKLYFVMHNQKIFQNLFIHVIVILTVMNKHWILTIWFIDLRFQIVIEEHVSCL